MNFEKCARFLKFAHIYIQGRHILCCIHTKHTYVRMYIATIPPNNTLYRVVIVRNLSDFAYTYSVTQV